MPSEEDPCDSDPCQNGAECQAQGGDYVCTCAAGYTGSNCETGKHPPYTRLSAIYIIIYYNSVLYMHVHLYTPCSIIPGCVESFLYLFFHHIFFHIKSLPMELY